MTAPPTTPVPAGDHATAPTTAVSAPRDPDLVLARVHLLLGSLSLARTELETLAGRGALDDGAIRDLAEARWRTGDAVGAGEAAAAWLEPGEARRLAGRAIEQADGSLDPVFAGMQRSAIWPVEPGSPIGPAGVLFDDLHPGPHAVHPLPSASRGDARFGTFDHVDDDGSRDPGDPFEPGLPRHAIGPSIWGDDDDAAAVPAVDDAVDPGTLFHRARAALEAGQAAEAATGLILALRASPGLAPAILDLLAGRSESILALVRGDAQRVVGREVEAMRDHAAAAGGVAGTDRVVDTPATSVLFPDDGPLPDHAAGAEGPPAVAQDVPDEPTTPVQEDS